MNKKQIILIGGGGHCKSCIEVIESTKEYKIVGIVDTKDKVGQEILNYRFIACDDDLEKLKEKYDYAMITVGQIKSANLRKKLFNLAKNIGFKLPVIIASSAYVSKHSKIGEGTIVMHQVMINANVKIGSNNIINSKVLIEHDTIIGNDNHISTGSILNGDVKVGNECFIGSNSTFINGIAVADNIFTGLNAVVNKNLKEKGIYVGNPVRKIR
jgi:sugar O-acyltransferase (sialic acid O-acetyltransferase NeuD family)